jgi:hydrogenase nickel incorporation protein HypB
MCETCGCGKPGEFTIHDPNHSHDHEHQHNHDHDHGHLHDHTHTHEHDHEHAAGHSPDHSHSKVIDLNVDILSENNRVAQLNRRFLEGRRVLCLNLVSSPGSGKTTMLEKTISALKSIRNLFVIEGDQQTMLDAGRIEMAGAPAIQINTGSGCHLDARMIDLALNKLNVTTGSILFIENVGNLVCPAMFDLGEHKRVVVISVTEGDDKPLKYPYMFETSHLCVINKSDLLPYVDFKTDNIIKHARSINPDLEFLIVSAKTGEGMKEWYDWLMKEGDKIS